MRQIETLDAMRVAPGTDVVTPERLRAGPAAEVMADRAAGEMDGARRSSLEATGAVRDSESSASQVSDRASAEADESEGRRFLVAHRIAHRIALGATALAVSGAAVASIYGATAHTDALSSTFSEIRRTFDGRPASEGRAAAEPKAPVALRAGCAPRDGTPERRVSTGAGPCAR